MNMIDIHRRVPRFPDGFINQVGRALDCCASIKNIRQWIERFDELTRAVQVGNVSYRQVEDHIFELKVINYIHEEWPELDITYQPAGGEREGKNCDIAVSGLEFPYFIELKSFHPDSRQRNIPHEHVAPDNVLIMDSQTYHEYQAVRGHLIDIALETEDKFRNYGGEFISVLGLSVGFYLSVEDMRDFVAIYRHGRPRPDDPLGKMTMYNLKTPFAGSIREFWAFPFYQTSFAFEEGDHPVVVAPLKSADRPIPMA